METWAYGTAAIAILLVGFAIGLAANDHFATRYWEMEISRLKKRQKAEITSTTVTEFNRGVLAALPSTNDKDIPND